MEGTAMMLDEANIWKCLVLLESEVEASEEMMHDMLCESVVKQKGVASVSILKNLERATGKPAKTVPKSPKIGGQGSPTDVSSELRIQQALMKETTLSFRHVPLPGDRLENQAPTTTNVMKSLSTKKARRKTTAPEKLASDARTTESADPASASDSKMVKKIVKIQERFKELFDGDDSN